MIPYGKHHIDEDDIQAVVQILKSDCITQGPAIEAFENGIANYVGARYAVAVSSGTAALHIAAKAAGANGSNSLITSPITFVASSNAALYSGGRPLFADIDPDTINISHLQVREILSNNHDVKIIMPVHFAGLPCDMLSLERLANESGSLIIEDAAHALGAEYSDGTKVGCCAKSLMTIFSFHPVKAITAGEGGMITTNDEQIYRRLLRLRSHGINKLDDSFILPDKAFRKGERDPWYYEMQELGYNYRITDIQSALALSQLKKLDKFIARRRQLVSVYDAEFMGMDNCRSTQINGRDYSAHHLYVVRFDFKAIGLTRKQFMDALKEKNILSQIHYIPVPYHPFYRELGFQPEDYPNALEYYQEALSIPMYYGLTDAQQQYVIASIKSLMSASQMTNKK